MSGGRSLNPTQVYKNHPAETAGPLAMAVAVLLADWIGIDDATTLTALAIVLSFIPAGVTWLVRRKRKRDEAAMKPTTLANVPPAPPDD